MLAQVLAAMPAIDDPNVIVGTATADDAGVYRLSDDTALVQTVDFFTPIVDDPATFGRIAAANALSDIYAMGAMPLVALAIAAFPEDADATILGQILAGGAEKAKEAGISIMGGHTVKDPEPKYGLAVTGIAHPGAILRNSTALAGDALVLTKPIGTGILTTARRADEISDADLAPAIESMQMLNRVAAETMLALNDREKSASPVHAATDVTGFGLIGHLLELARGSGCGFTLHSQHVRLFDRVLELAQRGIVPGGTKSNLRAALEAGVAFAESLGEPMRLALCDAQTSGGLLIAVAAAHADELVRTLTRSGVSSAAVVGSVTGERAYLVV